MSKGDRANLERLLRSAWERQTALRIENLSMPETSKSGLLRIVLEMVLGVGLSLVGIGELFPFPVTLVLYVLGIVFISIGIREAMRRGLRRFIIVTAVAITYVAIISFPGIRQYRNWLHFDVSFKDPQPSLVKRELIRYRCARFRDFLVDLGIPAPSSTPPITVGLYGPTQMTLALPSPALYRDSLDVGNGNGKLVTSAYCEFALSGYIGVALGGIKTNDAATVSEVLVLLSQFEVYLHSSFWNSVGVHPGPIVEILWDIRRQTSVEFTDRLAAATFKTMVDDPKDVVSTNLNTYVVRALMIGDSLIESRCDRWPIISKGLTASGVNKEMIASQVFSVGINQPCLDVLKQ